MDYLAYVYKIKFLKTGQYYIGYRYANIRLRRHPEDDLLIYYFSSSNIVKKMIKDQGIDTIQSEIIGHLLGEFAPTRKRPVIKKKKIVKKLYQIQLNGTKNTSKWSSCRSLS